MKFVHKFDLGVALVVWAVTGLVCMLGALCFAELALMLPGNIFFLFQKRFKITVQSFSKKLLFIKLR